MEDYYRQVIEENQRQLAIAALASSGRMIYDTRTGVAYAVPAHHTPVMIVERTPVRMYIAPPQPTIVIASRPTCYSGNCYRSPPVAPPPSPQLFRPMTSSSPQMSRPSDFNSGNPYSSDPRDPGYL